MIQYDYEYDLAHHPYRSEFIDAESGPLVQSFTVPEGVTQIHGLRVRLSRYGDPGPVRFTIHRPTERPPLGEGWIPAEAVTPVFERMVGGDFAPVPVRSGEMLVITLEVQSGRQPLDAYRVYGPNTREELLSEGNAHFPYWWYQRADIRLDDVNAPLPIGYTGAGYADYLGGERQDAHGQKTGSIAFQVLTELDPPPDPEIEQQFQFAQALTAEPFSEWRCIRDPHRLPAAGEIEITQAWQVICTAPHTALTRNAVQEIHTFLNKVMAVTPGTGTGAACITLGLEEAGSEEDAETFHVDIDAGQVTVRAAAERGLLRAIYWLEDQMLLRRAPILEAGRWQVKPRYTLRMVPGIYPAPSYFMLREAQMWTPGYLWRLSRAGYNAVYFQASIEDFVEDSAIFPELNDPEAPQVIERLRRAVELGAEYGIDFYWDLKTGYEKPFPESVYERLPHLRTFRKFGNFPCTGQAETLAFLNETIEHVFRCVEKLRGLILVYDTEGFYSCLTHNYKDHCPHCKDYPLEALANRLFDVLKGAARVIHADRDLILFTYICDEPWNYRLIECMPADVTLMACYSQLKALDRSGARVLTDDYSLCSDAPSDYFLKVQHLAVAKGMRFFAKTEDTFGQEFVSTPYTPCLEQHQRRWDRLAQEQASGVMTQYLHIGFTPTPCQDLMRLNVVTIEKDGQAYRLAAREKLHRVAVLNYGEAGAEHVLSAWDAFSTAIRDHYPYTWGVCRYPGPIQSAPGQPFNLDPRQPVPRPWARGYVNDLGWTGIRERFLLAGRWDHRVVARCFAEMVRWYAMGNNHLERALAIGDPLYRQALARALSVSRMQQSQMQTILNLITFLLLRKEYGQSPTPPVIDSLAAVLENELTNAQTALWLAERDSRLGYSGEGDGNVRGGHFTPATIRQKIAGLRAALDDLYAQQSAR